MSLESKFNDLIDAHARKLSAMRDEAQAMVALAEERVRVAKAEADERVQAATDDAVKVKRAEGERCEALLAQLAETQAALAEARATKIADPAPERAVVPSDSLESRIAALEALVIKKE